MILYHILTNMTPSLQPTEEYTEIIFRVIDFLQYSSILKIFRIWGSHGGWYEDGCLLGCSAV
jgi:hypothetical protein